ncbi:hypothetical protein C8A05DRAFT_41994 [Staphylotrichum tortipilum]|uniref:Complex 1 LYR protein domain-containing protein n=1 Tax=Staphylotrichum tortipilum TaxID=2831512 RepID=A0AAN6MS78_9PEZI|nr:hypothetical protein C8A05DRAFT_41994 [Staphylotrichum longicolle]
MTAVQVESAHRVLSLLLRQGNQFAAYNFREYAKRRTRDAFRENRSVEDPRRVQELVQKGLKELQMLKVRAAPWDGLPVRQWRQEWVTVAQTPPQDADDQDDIWAVDLPFGMPKESHLLPAHTQELLRAVRTGKIYKRSAPIDDDDYDYVDMDYPKPEKKECEPSNEGFLAKAWKQVPRNAETPMVSHLAKRHKNTITLSSKAAILPQAGGGTVVRATVRRIDAAGNPYEQTVTLAEGQQVEGEIISTTVIPTPAAAQGELPQQQATPIRRRPPPPKRKAKGAGRGRKKGKLPLPTPAPVPVPVATNVQPAPADGTPPVKQEEAGPSLITMQEQKIKIEEPEDSVIQDSEMVDVSGIASDDDEGEGGEGEEEEGDEEAGEDETLDTQNLEEINDDAPGRDVEDAEMSEVIRPSSVEEPDEPVKVAEEVEEVTIPKVRFQPPSLANLGVPHTGLQFGSSRIEGSPLKNVMVLSPTEPSPVLQPKAEDIPCPLPSNLEAPSDTVPMDTDPASPVAKEPSAEPKTEEVAPSPRDGAEASEPAVNPAPETAPLPVEEVTMTEAPASTLDQPQDASESEPAAPKTTETPEPAAKTSSPSPTPAPPAAAAPQAETADTEPEAALQPPDSPALLPTVTVDEDDGLNLLGSLERELDRQEGPSNADSTAGDDKEASPAVPAPAEEEKAEPGPGPEPEAAVKAEPEPEPEPEAKVKMETVSEDEAEAGAVETVAPEADVATADVVGAPVDTAADTAAAPAPAPEAGPDS